MLSENTQRAQFAVEKSQLKNHTHTHTHTFKVLKSIDMQLQRDSFFSGNTQQTLLELYDAVK